MVADRDLLFGLLALQVGLIDQGRLVAAFQAWTRDRARPLAEHLVGRGDLEADQRSAVEAMAALFLKKHGGDVESGLAKLPVGPSTRERLASLGDADLTATLAHLGSSPTEPDADATATFAVGSASADGLRYRVLRPHARGGLGAVFVAMDGELNREVALKQILDHHADDDVSRQRFVIEAEITGGLEHPGIVPVYGLGTYKDGRPYYAMRFIRGDSLKAAIERFRGDESLASDPGRRSLALRKLLRRFTDVCNAIEYAHSRGVLHRDIKPGNVIVGKHGETLVVDWGLAKVRGLGEGLEPAEERPLALSSASGSAETLPGSALGTPAYMSPEQARGDLEALGPRSDVYSLGATLYCLLTGRAPFEGGDLGTVLRLVKAGEFPPPRRLDPAIDRPLEAIALKAMATAPEGRYASARALAEDIERWLADEPVLAYPEPWTRTMARWLARHRTAVTGAAAALLVALVGLGAVVAAQTRGRAALAAKNGELVDSNRRLVEANRREAEARSIAEENAGEARRARARAEGRIGLALGAIEKFREAVDTNLEVKDRPENAGLRRELLRAPLEFYQKLRDDLGADLGASPEARFRLAEAVQALAALNEQLGSVPLALEQFRAATDLFGRVGADLAAPGDLRRRARDRRLRTLCDLGFQRENQGDRKAALADFATGVAEAEAEAEARPGDPEPRKGLARLIYGEGLSLYHGGKLAEALAHAVEARAQCGRVVALAPGDAEARELGSAVRSALEVPALVKLGRYDEALACLEAARGEVGRARAAGASSPVLDSAEAGLVRQSAEVYKQTGRHREELEARARYVEAQRARLRARPTAFGARRGLVSALLDLVTAREGAGQLEPALEGLREARAALEALRVDFPGSTLILGDLARAASIAGSIAYSQGRVVDAVDAFREVSTWRSALLALSPDDPGTRADLAGNEYNLGILLNDLGRTEESEAASGRSEAIRRRLVADFPDQPKHRLDLAHTLGNRANVSFIADKDFPSALRDYREAVGLLEALTRDYPKSAPIAESLTRIVSNFCSFLLSNLRVAEAETRARAVGPILARRVAAEPGAVQPRLDLAFALRTRGDILRHLRRGPEAERHYRDAIALIEPLVASGGEGNQAVLELAGLELMLARSLVEPAEAAEAAELAGRAAGRFEALRASGRADAESAGDHVEALRTRARRLALLGRAAEAEAEWDRAEALHAPDPAGRPGPSTRLELRAWSGDFDGFLAAAEAAGEPPEDELLALAKAASLASRRAGSPDRANALAARAVGWLAGARDLGQFRRDDVRLALIGPDLAPLADRADFRALALDATFPADPFAP